MNKSLDIESSSGMTFDQNCARKSFIKWLENSSKEPFVLSGYAGSGKTYLAMKFLGLVELKELCWTVVAPTHKAVGVLRKALLVEGLRPTWYPSTVHRLLRLKLKRNGYEELYKETGQTEKALEQLDLVLIDECSMIDSTLLEIILKCAHAFKTRLVFVGDPAQLPPVGEAQSPVFSLNRSVTTQLREVVRHQGPVLQLANCIREGVIPCYVPPCVPVVRTSQGLVASVDKMSWLNKAKKALRAASEQENPDSARILCYTNRVLERLVPHARRAIHGDMADQLPVLPGEVLITRKPVMAAASANGIGVGEDPDMLISSNREMVVTDVLPEICDTFDFISTDDYDIKAPVIETLVANVRCEEKEFSIRLLPQAWSDSRKLLDDFLKELTLIAKTAPNKQGKRFWRNYFFIRDSFASVGPASVLTVHRSQGSTFENVFVSSDVFWPNDMCLRKQLLYVAVSRASHQVWFAGNTKNESSDSIWKDQLKLFLD